ncbi:hypothetical protein J437_LFUL001868 [Ladona fulva]|uniref:Bestrophin homolog n=1 Tax=Ladona fulva TaxID=123851 RepID=A0A8K0JTV3_LADFU|nr:hypothetical protein J437_LFUL001868 [Ladona fulva]
MIDSINTMTVTYTAEVATCRGLGVFWKLLFRWRGSIYKLLWPNLVVYSFCYFTLSAVYRFGLKGEQKAMFEKVAVYCRAHSDLIPVSFVLGFYVSIVIKRWWDQYLGIPWPDNLAMFVSTLVHGNDERGRLMRRTILRYVNLCFVVTLCMMCPRVKKRFPTLEHLVEAGFLQPTELKIFEDLNRKTNHPKYWMPLVWAGSIVTRARKEGRVRDDFSMKTLIDGLCTFRGQCGGMLNYDWISIPLVYTQVVTLAVYIFFLASLMGNQFLDPGKAYSDQVDLVIPIFTFLQFFFYMGWLKVAESLVNPFGEDDDDFEVNWLVDRNLQVSYLIVDEMHNEHPDLVKDQYWDEVFPAELPYTAAAKQYQTGPPQGSTVLLNVREDEAEFLPMETVFEESNRNMDDDEVLVDIDEMQLDLEGGDRKRRETHPMKILMGRKSSVTSKMSVQSSSVVGGGHMNGGSRCKNGEVSEGIGRSLLGLSYSSSANKGTGASFRQKNLQAANQANVTLRQSGRKNSVLSMLARMFHRDDNRGELRSNHGSNASLRSHRRGAFGRSISRVSCSQANSRTSINRENTADFQDEIFKMSDLSICSNENEIQNIHQRQRKRSQQQMRQSRRKKSSKLSSVEAINDHLLKEQSSNQGIGDETPSTVASTPGEGEKDAMLGRRVWVKRKKGRDERKDILANEEEEEEEEELDDAEKFEGEDNGIWFSKKKRQEIEKSNTDMKEDASGSSTKYYRQGDAGADDLSLVSDSSVKTSFYHGSCDTLAESKGLGSATTVTSSPVAKNDNCNDNNLLNNQDLQKVGVAHSVGPIQQLTQSWLGKDKLTSDIHASQSLDNPSPSFEFSTARIVVPKKSDIPLKHVFETRQTAGSLLSHSPSLSNRARFTSQLAKGIAQMAAVKNDIPKKPHCDTLVSNADSVIEAEKVNENAIDNSHEKAFEDLPQNIHHSETLKRLIAPQSNISLQLDTTYKRLLSVPISNSPSTISPVLQATDQQNIQIVSEKLDTAFSFPSVQQPLSPGSSYTFPTRKDDLISPSALAKSASQSPDLSPHDSEMHTRMKGASSEVDTNEDMLIDYLSETKTSAKASLGGTDLLLSDERVSDSPSICQPHIPSTAIPVPSINSSHDKSMSSKTDTQEEKEDASLNNEEESGDASTDAVKTTEETEGVMGRRRMGGLREFVELEPIEENAEFNGSSANQSVNGSKLEEGLEWVDADDENNPPETSV